MNPLQQVVGGSVSTDIVHVHEISSDTPQLPMRHGDLMDRPLDRPTVITEIVIGQVLNLIPSCFKQHRMTYLMNILNEVEGCKVASLAADLERKSIEIEHIHGDSLKFFGTPNSDLLWSATFTTKIPHMLFMGPPTTNCLKCSKSLKSHNHPSQVLCFSWNGPLPALKTTLRCVECMINYRYKTILL